MYNLYFLFATNNLPTISIHCRFLRSFLHGIVIIILVIFIIITTTLVLILYKTRISNKILG